MVINLSVVININKCGFFKLEMEGWKYWEGKKVFIILKNKRQYSGTVLEVEVNINSPLVWISILDKFENRITFVNSEIELIQEENR